MMVYNAKAVTSLFVPSAEIENRLRCLQDLMTQEGLDGILLCQNMDLFYYSGTIQPGYLYIPDQDEPLLLVRKNLDRALEESSLSRIHLISSPKEIPSHLADSGLSMPQILGLEMDVLPANLFLQFKNSIKKAKILDASPIVRRCRMIKSEWEIENLLLSAEMVKKMVSIVPGLLRPGLAEIELAGLLEAFLRKEGHQGFLRTRGFNQEVYYGHVLSGPEGALSSYINAPSGGLGISPAFSQGSGKRLIRPEEPVSIDYCGCYNGYIVDQTRMFSIGDPGPEALRAFEAVRKILKSTEIKAQPGVSCDQLYHWALAEADQLGYGDSFMGVSPNQAPYVGHGVGLDLDELPIIGTKFDWPIEEGMVIALEPKILLPNIGLVGLENTYHLTAEGLVPLTTAPEEFQILPQ
jgi:Xaa-Pro aminopeptidase